MSYLINYKKCPYNRRHFVPNFDFLSHLEQCRRRNPDRTYILCHCMYFIENTLMVDHLANCLQYEAFLRGTFRGVNPIAGNEGADEDHDVRLHRRMAQRERIARIDGWVAHAQQRINELEEEARQVRIREAARQVRERNNNIEEEEQQGNGNGNNPGDNEAAVDDDDDVDEGVDL